MNNRNPAYYPVANNPWQEEASSHINDVEIFIETIVR